MKTPENGKAFVIAEAQIRMKTPETGKAFVIAEARIRMTKQENGNAFVATTIKTTTIKTTTAMKLTRYDKGEFLSNLRSNYWRNKKD